MILHSLLPLKQIIIPLTGRDKTAVIRELVLTWADSRIAEEIIRDVLVREQKMTTGIGLSVAIPHTYSERVNEFHLSVGIAKDEIDFQSIDYKPVKLIFLDVVPYTHLNLHREYLQHLSMLLYKEDQRDLLIHSLNSADFLESLKIIEEGMTT